MENQDINPIPTTPVTPPTPPAPGTPSTQITFPGAIKWMVFGIISCFGFCGWIPFAGIAFGVVGLIFGILAFKNGKKMETEYMANINMYNKGSKVFITIAKITGLVGLIASAVCLLIGLILTVVALVAESSNLF
jgi:hypothetical protein